MWSTIRKPTNNIKHACMDVNGDNRQLELDWPEARSKNCMQRRTLRNTKNKQQILLPNKSRREIVPLIRIRKEHSLSYERANSFHDY